MNFASDNTAGFSPEMLEALVRANEGRAMPYGNDDVTARVKGRIAEIFETEVEVFPVATGTAANALSLSLLAPAWGAIWCHPESHVNTDECAAPEFYTGGGKLIPVPGEHGKISADGLAKSLEYAGHRGVHEALPSAVTISQASEAGTIYTPDEIAAISELCRSRDLGLHMDGARFANALVTLDCSPAEATWKAGVDILSFGATKNGALAAEAIVIFTEKLRNRAAEIGFRRKRAAHLFSKMRFLSAQLDVYLADDLWLRSARHANAMAAGLAKGLTALPGVQLTHPVEANELFPAVPAAIRDGLRKDGFEFYDWPDAGPDGIRLICAFDTREDDVEAFLKSARFHADAAA
ncbi:MAG: low specificity L-threonine aldolase [Alphaproteobacteria bacterium]|nr:low specificity L-threonine aldolase [Alphaproteobacteria bacterium]